MKKYIISSVNSLDLILFASHLYLLQFIPSKFEVVQQKELQSRLKDGEKGKLWHSGVTDKDSWVMMSRDEILDDMVDKYMALIHSPVSPHVNVWTLHIHFL